jgi:hypothetical protein
VQRRGAAPPTYNSEVQEARRTVARWILAALIERGPQTARPPREATPLERPLSPHEARRLRGRSPLLPQPL